MTLVMKLTNNEKLIAAKQSSFVVTAFGGEEWPVLYNIRGGGLAQLLYNVTWGRGMLKKWHFLLYNMWTAPKHKRSCF